jgi:hypothetical protein
LKVIIFHAVMQGKNSGFGIVGALLVINVVVAWQERTSFEV